MFFIKLQQHKATPGRKKKKKKNKKQSLNFYLSTAMSSAEDILNISFFFFIIEIQIFIAIFGFSMKNAFK